MPVYEYECQSCGRRFEVRRRIGESDSEVKCPGCGADHPLRVFSSFATGSGGPGCGSGGYT